MNLKWLLEKVEKNWPAKVLCIALALILFIFHRMSVLESRFFSVPLKVEHMNSLMPSLSYPRMIRVTLKGEANSIFPVFEDDIEAFIDMEKYTSPGTYNIPVEWRKKGTALGVDALQVTVDPAEISFRLDYKISKYVPVIPNFRGQADSGYTMTSYTLNPNQVVIEGPADLMAGISELYTEPIDLGGRRNEFSGIVNLLNGDSLIVVRGASTTTLNGVITQLISVRNFLDVPIAITSLGEGLTGELGTKTANIHMEAQTQELIDNFTLSPEFLKVKCSEITEAGTYTLAVQAASAEGINVRVNPAEVKIVITHTGEEE